MGAQQAFQEFVARYGPAGEEGPERLVREIFGAEPDAFQLQVLRSYGRGERRVSIRSCHGVGKTAVLAWIILHQLLTTYPQKAVATAPTASQVYDALYAEVLKWLRRLAQPLQALFVVKSDRIELAASPEESFFSVRTARAEKPEALQGIHSDDGRVLLIADEASGVPDEIFEAAAGSMSGRWATTILASNPTRTNGFFFDTHHDLRDMWLTIHVSHEMSERVDPDFIEDIARRYGRESNAFRVRCLGEFPRADKDTIIPYELVEAARARDIQPAPHLVPVWGLDVARFGDDSSALVCRDRLMVHDVTIWRHLDMMELVGRVKARYDGANDGERPRSICVDVIGYGAGAVDRLQELGLPVRGINVAEAATEKERYLNLRAELWFQARQWLESRDHRLPPPTRDGDDPVETLCAELIVPRYSYTSSGRIMAETKADMKRRGKQSPNAADAFCLTFAEEPAIMATGGRYAAGQPLRRNLGGIV